MNLIDVGIVVVLAFGIYIGWRNGLIGPLLAEGTFLIGYFIVSRNPSLAGLVPSSIPRAYAILILPGIVGLVVGIVGRMVFQTFFRLPFTRQVDKVLGAVANGALAFVIVYVVVLGFVGAGTVLDPLATVTAIREPQIIAMQTLLKDNPQAAAMVPSAELGQLSSVASVQQAIPLTRLGQYAQVINYYESTLKPQLKSSVLAPIVLRLGAHLPIIGRTATIPKG
jgi:uncharacterized membrane protein required for colicin V production